MRHVYVSSDKPKAISLPFYGQSVCGETVGIDSQCMRKNGKPWFPITGEFQYSRFSESDWEKELYKMKANGIECISSYVFWIHHEEERGVYRFDGCRDVRRYAKLCQKVGLTLILRIGPWVTGECRNGGFPDWVLDLPDVYGKVHGDTPEFMQVLREYYTEFYNQISDLFWNDGGCIIGIQLDNEYTIHRAHSLENGFSYMHELKNLLIEIGYDVPFYYYTAWNRALFEGQEALPMFGAYCDEPWSPLLTELEPLSRFLFADERAIDIYGSGVEANRMVSDDLVEIDEVDTVLRKKYNALIPTPYLTAELGGGMQPSEFRRIVCEEDDTEALALCMLGRGANMLGYYIFHGGTHPTGTLSYTNSVVREGVMSNTYPSKSYDFAAPIGEDNQLKHCCHALRRRHLMVKELEGILAETSPIFPEDNATCNIDLTALRYSVRYDADTKAGFVFFNNHVRKRTMPQRVEEIIIHLDHEELVLPKIRLMNHEMKIIPFNLPLGDAILRSTNAEFLTRLGERYFFYTNEEPIYDLEGDVAITTLTAQEALYAWKFGEKLYISEQAMYEKDGMIYLDSKKPVETLYYYDSDGIKHQKTVVAQMVEQKYHTTEVCTEEKIKIYKLDMRDIKTDQIEDILMTIDYIGDVVEVYDGDALIGDYFTTGETYTITLKRFAYPKELSIKVIESAPRETRYFDLPVAHGCELLSVTLENIYQLII